MRALFRPGLDAHQITFAIGESIAHLNRLASLGLVERTRTPGLPDRYERVGWRRSAHPGEEQGVEEATATLLPCAAKAH
jgi:hypothetical protein